MTQVPPCLGLERHEENISEQSRLMTAVEYNGKRSPSVNFYCPGIRSYTNILQLKKPPLPCGKSGFENMLL